MIQLHVVIYFKIKTSIQINKTEVSVYYIKLTTFD